MFPNEVLLLKAAKDIKKAALISNFVDRESERPTLGADDFVPLRITDSANNHEKENVPQARNKSRYGLYMLVFKKINYWSKCFVDFIDTCCCDLINESVVLDQESVKDVMDQLAWMINVARVGMMPLKIRRERQLDLVPRR